MTSYTGVEEGPSAPSLDPIVSLSCGGCTLSTQSLLSKLRIKTEPFRNTSFVVDQPYLALLIPLLQLAIETKKDTENGRWGKFDTKLAIEEAKHNERLNDGLRFLS
eukprot:scaffold34917_cov166-Amphora_coffeaeformis.AAC.10